MIRERDCDDGDLKNLTEVDADEFDTSLRVPSDRPEGDYESRVNRLLEQRA